jgi:hypothetical protein
MLDLTLTFDNGPEPDVTPGVLDAAHTAFDRRKPLHADGAIAHFTGYFAHRVRSHVADGWNRQGESYDT